jgi:hypothetical protein
MPRSRAATLGRAVVPIVLACVAPAAGQEATASLGGSVTARGTLRAVEGARMTVLGTPLVAFTDSAGRFLVPAVPAGVRVLQARAIGYETGSWIVQLTAGQNFRQPIELEPRPIVVEGMTVEGQAHDWRSPAAFDRRRATGRGHFITREEIRNRRAENVADLLRTVPGVHAQCRGLANCVVTVGRTQGRSCRPEYFLDGFPATFSTGPVFPINQIRGVEVYRDPSEVPVEFQRPNLRCGVIAIWTVDPGDRLDRD